MDWAWLSLALTHLVKVWVLGFENSDCAWRGDADVIVEGREWEGKCRGKKGVRKVILMVTIRADNPLIALIFVNYIHIA